MKMLRLFISIAFLVSTAHLMARTSSDPVYLFCYFNNNGADGLHLAYSNDGYNWKALNNDVSVLKPLVGNDKLMRDPCIIRGGDGKFHMVWTVSWKERSIGYASSSDLLNWSEQQNIPVMDKEPTAKNCWAPELFYDKENDEYMIYWATTIPGRFPETEITPASNHRIYYVTTKDFKTYSETKLLFDAGVNVIDATIQKIGKKYVMFIKDETNSAAPKKDIHILSSDKLTGGYGKLGPAITGNYWAEGPTTVKIGNQWVVYFDKFRDHFYGAVTSGDLKTWTDISDKITYPKGLRHGTIFTVTQKEFVNLQNGLADKKPTFSQIESGFKTIPDSLKTSVYWYWMSDNISKEGVIKDLNAMKRVGINRAFIGNIGGQGVPYGKVKIFTDEWWDILHTALKTATDLNIEIGIFNSPGWSQSGGPWVKNEQSMRYLNSSEVKVTGPMKFSGKPPTPNADFQPVRTIAYKAMTGAEKAYKTLNPKITSEPKTDHIAAIFDGDNKTEVAISRDKTLTVDFETRETATIRSLIIKASEKKTKAKGELLVKEGNEFRSLKIFEINRSNPSLNVGFDPFAPIVLSIPTTKGKVFRLVVSGVEVPGGIAEVELSALPKIERYPEKSLAKMFQTPLPYWKDYLWDAQPPLDDKSLVIDPKSVVDITTNRAADGTVTWDVPAGNWVILQTGMTTTGVTNGPASPEGTGLETDKMSKKHIAAHFDAYLGQIIKRIPAADRKSWKVAVEDSYETGGQNWTDGMIEEFTKKYGYNPIVYLPVLQGNVVGSRDLSDRFLWDLRRMVADKVSYDYVGGLKEVCHKNGLTTWLENYGHWGFPGEFLQYGGQSDEIGGEFWSEGSLGDIENRAASSCAHIYGKQKVSAESFTCGGKAYSRYPATMKQRGDRFFTEGINNTLLHVFIEQPDERVPGINAGFGNEFNRNNTWFNYMDLFTQYLKRTNFMLQQGNYVADVAYFIGEDAPKMTGICDPALPKGYSFDYINGEVINTRLSVKDGKLMLPDGMNYRILVLPKLETMRPELLRRIKDLVLQGAIVLGPAPKYSPSLQDFPKADMEVQRLASELWGKVDGIKVKSAKVGKGMILSGMEMQEAFDLLDVVPDCKFGPEDPALFIHRKMADGEAYFISNQSDKTIFVDPEFRVNGKSPEFWNPVNGTSRPLPAFQQNARTTKVSLKLEPYESQFIVFRKKAVKPGVAGVLANFPDGKLLAELKSNWMVSFDHSKLNRGPVNPVNFATLSDWTLSTNDSIKYYSGTAVYRTSFRLNDVPSDGKILLNLGQLTAMAKVKVNGQEVGGVWTAPYQSDISAAVKTGENRVEIAVVNDWMNRLIGDQKMPVEQRPTWTITMPYKAESPLQPSGLFGPVTILSFNM